MNSKLFFFILILLTMSSQFENKNLKRKRQENDTNFDIQTNTQIFTFPLQKNKGQHELRFIIEMSSINLILNKILENQKNIFANIFPYLTLFENEFKVQCICQTIHNLYKIFKDTEKHKMENVREDNFSEISRNYFDFFEKKDFFFTHTPNFVNAYTFSKNLFIFPKGIRHIMCLGPSNGVEFKYILFKNGELLILKKLQDQLKLTSLVENDFNTIDDSFRLKRFSKNIRCLESVPGDKMLVVISFLDKQRMFKLLPNDVNPQKIYVFFLGAVYKFKSLMLKNSPEHLILQDDGVVDYIKYEKENDQLGYWSQKIIRNFKLNVKDFQSKDFEHFAHEVQFIFLE